MSLGAAIFLLLAMFSIASSAGVIYEYREVGSPKVIGTMEWAAPSDLIALFLDDAIFGLGSANLLSVGGTVSIGSDGGSIGIRFPTIFPVVPTDPTIDQSLSMWFGPSSGEDVIAVATYKTFPDGSVEIADQFIYGNWVAQVPEPGTLMLLVIGLLGVGWSATRKRALRNARLVRASTPSDPPRHVDP